MMNTTDKAPPEIAHILFFPRTPAVISGIDPLLVFEGCHAAAIAENCSPQKVREIKPFAGPSVQPIIMEADGGYHGAEIAGAAEVRRAARKAALSVVTNG